MEKMTGTIIKPYSVSIPIKNLLNWLIKYKNIFVIFWMIGCLVFVFYGWKLGVFTSTEKMEMFLNRYGIFAPIIFVLFQLVQVVIPILPGGIGCVFGVMFFGAVNGFIFNYIGICLGSIIAFALGRSYGKNFVKKMTGQKFYDKYNKYLDAKHGFNKFLAICIFLPIAPDDFLCYLAGISEISYKKFLAIILLGKPGSIFLYSIGLDAILHIVLKYF